MRCRRGLLISEVIFLLLILGSFAALGVTLWLNRASARPARASSREIRSKSLEYLTRTQESAPAAVSGGARTSGTRVGGGGDEGMIVARDTLDPALAAQLRPSHGARPPRGEMEAPRPLKQAVRPEQGMSVFVPSKRGLPIQHKTQDAWTGWADANRRNITGAQGAAELNAAFTLAEGTRARELIADLVRKGIDIGFGAAEDFTGAQATHVAVFEYNVMDRPVDGHPAVLPVIRFNPAYLGEAPTVLAAALVHEATHFQQFLDGSLFDTARDDVDTEYVAWANEAAFWDEVRGSAGAPEGELAAQAEFAYRTALRGEAALRDLLEALHG